jgi:hypothetical protein
MSTMTLRGPVAPTKVGGFSRVYKWARMWVEIFSEAQRMAQQAERRFGFRC